MIVELGNVHHLQTPHKLRLEIEDEVSFHQEERFSGPILSSSFLACSAESLHLALLLIGVEVCEVAAHEFVIGKRQLVVDALPFVLPSLQGDLTDTLLSGSTLPEYRVGIT